MKEIIYVDNLKCNGCASTIKSKLTALKGVTDVEIEVEENKIQVAHEEGVTKETLMETLSKLGYPEQGTSNMYQKAVSYVSCATGKMSGS